MSRKRPRDGLLSRLARPFTALGRLVGSREEEAPGIAIDVGDVADNVVEDSFTLALETMLIEDQGQFQTKLQVISLVEFREAVGDKWHRLSEKVMMIAEGVINLHIGPGNVYGRRGQDFFVLLFRNIPQAEGRRRAVQIAQELGTRLVGAQFVGHERPLALATEISLADAMAPDGGLDLAAILNAVGQMRALVASTAPPRAGYRPHLTKPPVADDPQIHHSALPPPLPEQGDLRAHLRPSKLSAKDFVPRRSMLPVQMPAKTEAAPRQVAAPTWTAVEMTDHARPADDGPGGAPPMPGDATLSLAWRPTWMAAGEVIGAYRAQVNRVDMPGHAPFEGCRAYPADGGETALALDRFTIGAAVREMRSGDTAAAIVLPLHWASACSPRRLSLLAPLGDLSEEIRADRLIIDLFGIPDGVGDGQLTATIQALRPLCKEVMLRVRLSHPRAPRAAECGIATIGIDLAELPHSERTDDDSLLDALARLHQKADAARLGVYAWGIRRRAVVVGTVLGGFAMIDGPGLMKDLARPAKILPAPRSRLAGGAKP
ncbi:MAG: hypothetical protein EPN20_20045 [Magnetospirillum sp.]|nr:MAG: hypothetical protein EPN20_20045 [Magnetospirillum sp.]